jgi:hypothetical protein
MLLQSWLLLILLATSKNVIPTKAGIQKLLTILDSRLRRSDKLVIIRGILLFEWFFQKC